MLYLYDTLNIMCFICKITLMMCIIWRIRLSCALFVWYTYDAHYLSCSYDTLKRCSQFIYYLFQFLPAVSTLLNITCPYAHNWYLTASVKCHSVANYTCLYDSVNKNYKQNCKGPSKKPPGMFLQVLLSQISCIIWRYSSDRTYY